MSPPSIRNALLARAMRHVEAEWQESRHTSASAAEIAPILMMTILAADRGEASFLDQVVPRPSLKLSLHLIDRLQDAVLALWSSPAQALETIGRLRFVRAAVERRFQQLPGAPLIGIDGLEFLVEFVHDLRSPLSSLQLLADRLLNGWSGPITAVQQRQLRLMYSAAYALNNVTSNALQVTRDWDRLEEPEAQPFSITRVLSDVQELVRTLAVQKGLEIRIVRPGLDLRCGHAIELQRILLNLVTNALKFTRTGTVTVSASDRDDDCVEFAVQDTGPGIDPSLRRTLFEPFRRSNGRATFSATRLGLAITQRLVRALGGKLAYETKPDEGTRFYFVVRLPRA